MANHSPAPDSISNFYACRLPGAKDILAGASSRILDYNENSDTHGWIFASFSNPEDLKIIPDDIRTAEIPDSLILSIAAEFDSAENGRFQTTSRARHIDYVSNIVRTLQSRGGDRKTVAARTAVADMEVLPSVMFRRLCERYPDAFVFLFAAEGFGAWIGASPELLLKRSGSHWNTMSLAGTRPSGTAGEWDMKNIVEQQIVTDYITDVLSCHGLSVTTEERRVRRAGPIEHLCTPITADGYPAGGVTALLEQLSPTPALCGFPRDEAMETIAAGEPAGRMLYGGFVGLLYPHDEMELYVNLRSALIGDRRIMLFAGGGITALSDPEAEWEETERKLSTLRPFTVK